MQWRMLIEPSKYPLSEADSLFSKRLESVRKDVECFFGILKMRFRILELAMTYQKQERLDYVFFTCCILHNMLHTHDGMDGLEKTVNWVGSAELQNTSGHNLDSSSVGTKDVNDKPQVEATHPCGAQAEADHELPVPQEAQEGHSGWLSRKRPEI